MPQTLHPGFGGIGRNSSLRFFCFRILTLLHGFPGWIEKTTNLLHLHSSSNLHLHPLHIMKQHETSWFSSSFQAFGSPTTWQREDWWCNHPQGRRARETPCPLCPGTRHQEIASRPGSSSGEHWACIKGRFGAEISRSNHLWSIDPK